MVSVCMATYNGGQFIQKQIESILCQLKSEDELIISDDGSTDNTYEIIMKFNDRRIQLVSNTGSKGPVGNFENSLKLASGRFVFLADQDDVWLEGKVEETSVLLEEYDLVLSDCEVVNESHNVIYESFFHHRRSRKGFLNNLYKNSYMGCCMAFRQEILAYALPIPSGIHMHDWWIGLLVEAKGQVVFNQNQLLKYVRHGGNASRTGEAGYGLIQKVVNRYHMVINILQRLIKIKFNNNW